MKKKLLLVAAFVSLLGLGVAGFSALQSKALYETRNCGSSAIVPCGAYTQAELDARLTAETRGVFAHFGVPTNLSGAQSGVLNTNGDIVVNGAVVATGAQSLGRVHRSGSTAVAIGGKTYYQHPASVAFPDATPVFVFFDQYGRFVAAYAKVCGNPIIATAVKPLPSLECTGLKADKISRNTYRFTASWNAQNGAAATGWLFDWGDGTSETWNGHIRDHTYAKPGTYTARVTIKSNIGDRTSNSCVVKVTVENEPTAACQALTATVSKRTNVALKATATVANGATISGYVFTITDAGGKTVYNQTVSSTTTTATTNTTLAAGTYTAAVTVKTSLGDKTAESCKAKITIDKEKTPGVSIDKKVDGVEHKQVAVNQEFTYQLVVTNKGETDLSDVKVTDPAPANVQFISADTGTITDNAWSYTIPSLKVGESMSFAIKAKVTKEVEGAIVNTACVDAPSVPGSPDDCDEASVEVPPTTPPVTPPELPTTGIASTLMQLLGLSSLTAAIVYYAVSASRR